MRTSRWWLYYSRWSRRAFKNAWFVAAIVNAVVGGTARYLQDKHSTYVPTMSHLAWQIPFWLFIGLMVVSVFRVPYLLHKEDVPPNQRELEIVFDEKDEDYHWDYQNNAASIRLYKVGVRNKGKVTVQGPNLRLISMAPRPSTFYDFPLHSMHGKSWGLNPGVTEFFDVLQMSDEPHSKISIYPNDMPDGQKYFDFPRGEYELKIRADGIDTMPTERTFVVAVHPEGNLLFHPKGAMQSVSQK